MSVWSETFLGIIAVAALAMAVAQVGVLVAAGLLMRRMQKLTDTLERELLPIFGHLNSIGRDASRAAALATAQVERVDQLFTDLTRRFEQLSNVLQGTLASAREGRAMWSAFWAVLDAVRESRARSRSRGGRGDDEDALFI